jgi:hypothetical protein
MSRILDYKDYVKLKNLLHGSDEDANLALAIVDKCDVKHSFPWIVSLISQRNNAIYAMSSLMCKSDAVCVYIATLLGKEPFPLEYRLDFLMRLIKIHEDKSQHKLTASMAKTIINDYNSLKQEKSEMFTFKPVLKPKKNVK